MGDKLTEKKCIPCSGDMAPFNAAEIAAHCKVVPSWTFDGHVLKKTFRFKNFVLLMEFVNKMAELAETEGHHPNFTASYNILDVSIWTHKINGLTENDFILAAKIDKLR